MEKNNYRNAIYGAVIGDALGVPYEFQRRGSFHCVDMVGYGTHMQPPGTWSDDSSMLLATCRALKDNKGRIDIGLMLDYFRQWKYKGRFTPDGNVFDIGCTTSNALRTGESQTGEYDNGNGSLMRILPLAFTNCSDDEICDVSAITHGHPISMRCCVRYVHIVRDIANGANFWNKVNADSYLSEIVHADIDDIRSGGFVEHTFKAALWCVYNTRTFKECLLCAVNLGDDTDTTACVAGGLAGTIYQLNDLPNNWIDILRGKDIIEDCI